MIRSDGQVHRVFPCLQSKIDMRVEGAARFVARSLLALVVAACSNDAEDRGATTEFSDSAGVMIAFTRIGDGAPACRLGEETLRIGSADEASGATLFGVNDAAVLGDGRIAVVNRGTSQIKVFSPTGELVHEFGRQGPGPGEFKNLWSVDVRGGDTLVVGDYRPWRFSFFMPDGALVRQAELRPPVIERPDFALPLGAGAGFIMEEPAFEVQDEMVDRVVPLHRYAEDGERIGAVGDFWLDRFGYLSKELRFVGSPIFGAHASFAHLGDDLILYGAGRHEQLEVWSVEGTLRRIVRWQSRDRAVAANDADVWRRRRREAMEARFEITPEMEPVIEAQIGPHLPVANVFPGHDQVVASRDGGIWVEDYRRPLDEGPARWWVFAADGTFVCGASLPTSVAVLAVGADRVFGVEMDSLDVEYLVAYDVPQATAADVDGSVRRE